MAQSDLYLNNRYLATVAKQPHFQDICYYGNTSCHVLTYHTILVNQISITDFHLGNKYSIG